MLSSRTRSYTLQGLIATPTILKRLLRELSPDSARWDARPDAQRFTLREILCHLVDYDEVGLARLQRMRQEANPELANWDEEAAVVGNDYASANPQATLLRLVAHREKLIEWLNALEADDWARTGSHVQLGSFIIEEYVVHLLAHDAYHILQVTQWLDSFDDTLAKDTPTIG